MNESIVPNNITKVERDQFLTYLDTTPLTANPTLAVLGVGITEYGISYNPNVETEKWIIERNTRTDHESNQKQASVNQKIYKGDPCFEFVYAGLDKLNYKTHILDIDTWNGTNDTYPAKYSDGIIVVTQYMSNTATVEYDLYYDGDPVDGSVTFSSQGVPTFTPNTSL